MTLNAGEKNTIRDAMGANGVSIAQEIDAKVTTPTAPSAYTQTYSTANRTVAAPTGAAPAAATVVAQTSLTDNSGGAAADGTIGAVTTFTPSVAWNGSSVYPSAADATAIAAAITALMAAVKELSTKVNLLVTASNALAADRAADVTQITALVADDLDNRQTVTALIDDLQATGIVS